MHLQFCREIRRLDLCWLECVQWSSVAGMTMLVQTGVSVSRADTMAGSADTIVDNNDTKHGVGE